MKRAMPLKLRTTGERIVVAQASNDTTPDAYRTVITVEGLHEWALGYIQHRTVNLQHGRDMRGIRGKNLVGVATKIDFTPQLTVEIRVLDDEAWRLIEEGVITGASLEFVPNTEERVGDYVVYRSLSSEPEYTGLALVDIPAVPGADILSVRASDDIPLWAYAVVDPVVWERGASMDEIHRYAWFPHHDIRTRRPIPDAVAFAYEAVQRGLIEIPDGATLTREEVAARAMAHLGRHMNEVTIRVVPDNPPRYGKRRGRGWKAPTLSDFTDMTWDELDREEKTRIAQHFAWAPKMPPDRFTDLKLPHHDPEDGAVVYEAVVAAIAALNGARGGVDIPAEERERVYRHLAAHYREFDEEPPELRMELEEDTMENERNELEAQETVAQEPEPVAAQAPDTRALEERLHQLEQALEEARKQRAPVSAMAHIRTTERFDDDGLGFVLERTLIPLLRGKRPPPDALQEVENYLRAHGISERSLFIEDNGLVLYKETARKFLLKPEADTVGRALFRSVPMAGTKKLSMPVADQGTIRVIWAAMDNRNTVHPGQPVHSEVALEVESLVAQSVPIGDGFLQFNVAGAAYVQDVLLPLMRRAMQQAEDSAFFTSNGALMPWRGFLYVSGANVVTPENPTQGDPLGPRVFSRMLRALPARYFQPNRLAFFVPYAHGIVWQEYLATRGYAGALFNNVPDAAPPGPRPIGTFMGIPIYAVTVLPMESISGRPTGTLYLVHLDSPLIGDALTLRVEPYRQPLFKTVIQMHEWIGFVIQFPDAVVRHPGVRPEVA